MNGGQPSNTSPLRLALVIVPLLLVVLGSIYLAGWWMTQRHDVGAERPNDRPQQAERRSPDKEAASGTSTGTGKIEARKNDFDAAVVVRLLPKASPTEGAAVFRVCTACHTDQRNGPHKIGSNLWNIVGSPKAARPEFRYSQALRAKTGTWSYRELAEYLHDPRKSVPGTSMAFAGITDNERMANLIAYMRTLSDKPAPLPK